VKLSMLSTRSWEGHVMGTEARLAVVTDDRGAGHAALVRAVEDLEDTEKALSRFWRHSDLSRLNRSRTTIADDRLLTAIETAIEAYEWSDGLLDPRVIAPLERFGYRDGVPRDDVGEVEAADPLPPADMRAWIGPGGMVSLPDGVRMDLAGVGKALGIGWAALCLAGHAGLLVDVGGDVVALGVVDEGGEPWRVLAMHEARVGEFSGSSLTVATSTTRKRSYSRGARRRTTS
jgi:thiamine biosynthesis lipoprotein